MAVTDEDEERTVRVVLADVEATLGLGYESMVRDIAGRLRQFIDDPCTTADILCGLATEAGGARRMPC